MLCTKHTKHSRPLWKPMMPSLLYHLTLTFSFELGIGFYFGKHCKTRLKNRTSTLQCVLRTKWCFKTPKRRVNVWNKINTSVFRMRLTVCKSGPSCTIPDYYRSDIKFCYFKVKISYTRSDETVKRLNLMSLQCESVISVTGASVTKVYDPVRQYVKVILVQLCWLWLSRQDVTLQLTAWPVII